MYSKFLAIISIILLFPAAVFGARGHTVIEGKPITTTFLTAQGADVASANNMTLGDDGNFFDITGVTTINTIVTKGIGTEVTLQFDGILQLTHSADLFLPTAANITTAAGDIAMFYEYATSDWRCDSYMRADGTPVGGPPIDATYITQTANAVLTAEQALAALSTGIMRVATTTGIVTSLTDSAGVFANVSDETGGTGVLVGSISPVFTTDISVQGLTGAMACVNLSADAAEDNSDLWRYCVADGGNATLESFTSGSWVAKWTITNAGAFTLPGSLTANSAILDGGTNTFSITNGTASLDVAAAATVDIDNSLTVDGTATTITGVTQANTVTLNESFTVGGGSNVTLAATGAAGSVTLTKQTLEIEGEGTATQLTKIINANNAAATITIEGTSATVDQDTTADASPTHVTVDLTGITDTNIPNMAAAGAGFEDSPLTTDGVDVSSSGGLIAAPVEDPVVFYDALDAQDTDWYTGTNADAGATSDDHFEVRTSATPGMELAISHSPTNKTTFLWGPRSDQLYTWIEEFDDEASGVQWESGLRADFWITAGTNYAAANVTYQAGIGGTLTVTNAAADNDSVNTLGVANFRVNSNPICEAIIQIDDITTVHWAVGLAEGAYVSNAAYDDDIILIGQDTDQAVGNVYLITNNNNTGAIFDDTGIDAVNGTYLTVKFDTTDVDQPRVWINQTEVAAVSITGTIQAGTTLMPYIMVQNLAGGSIQRAVTIDSFKCWQDRG